MSSPGMSLRKPGQRRPPAEGPTEEQVVAFEHAAESIASKVPGEAPALAPTAVATLPPPAPDERGIRQDPDVPTLFHRVGRGARPARTVKRIQIYLRTDLLVRADRYRAGKLGQLDRGALIEAALEEYLGRHEQA